MDRQRESCGEADVHRRQSTARAYLAAGPDAVLCAGAAEAIAGCAAATNGLGAGGWASTKLKMVPFGNVTCGPVATGVTRADETAWAGCPSRLRASSEMNRRTVGDSRGTSA